MILLSGELLRQEKTLQKRIKKNTKEVTVNKEKNSNILSNIRLR